MFPSKLPQVGTTIFTVMSKMAAEYNAINLSQGFPDFDCDPELTALTYQYMRQGFNQYAPMPGLPLLRERIAQKFNALYGSALDPDNEITITAGGTQAIYTAITAAVHPADEVIIFEPAYDCYAPTITLQGATPIAIPLLAPFFKIPWDEVRAKITHKTRMIIINNPHNPTGSILNQTDVNELANLVRNTNIIILADEVYEHLTFDDQKHQTLLAHPELKERTYAIYSFGKLLHATGWKIGYCVAAPALTTEFRRVHQFLVFSVNTPLQYAIAHYLANAASYQNVQPFYEQKRNLFWQLMQNTKFTGIPTQGSYFQLLNYQAITQQPDTDFAIALTQKTGVAAIPVSAFYSSEASKKQTYLRFCFAKKDETLQKAADLLRKL
ncbi:MAG: methionine aminotransferase [Sphingobacteriales bacterium]|jgi:methionine aminotransferase|nr:methionine aminotransferase [Sphingobacteriales bacterium]MBK7526502.1 methionine aminotransferase [Sphingobacteriales bacterium]MBK8679926.1 methionine aminotransferase [Sphingobacteriales bacterium]MBL0247481.1 methionine aminotransferase [Sphingobacteriales bacterium]